VIAAHRYHAGVHDAAAREHGDVTRAAAHIDDNDAALDLVFRDDCFRRREHLQHHVIDVQASLVHDLHHVLNGSVGAGDDVRVDLQTNA